MLGGFNTKTAGYCRRNKSGSQKLFFQCYTSSRYAFQKLWKKIWICACRYPTSFV